MSTSSQNKSNPSHKDIKQYTQTSQIFSQVSVNSSRFQEQKQARRDRDFGILSKIANMQAKLQKNRTLANDCLKFRPIKKQAKQN